VLYLAILVLLAAGGIFKLWRFQRRAARLDSVDEFWSGLERISAQPRPQPREKVERDPAVRAVAPRRSGRRPDPLDPDRRAAAKRRIEARRRAMRIAG
jgi:hypothetical protein